MNSLKKFFGSILGKSLLIILVVVLGFSVRYTLEQHSKRQEQKALKEGINTRVINYAKMVDEDNAILQVFKKAFPDVEVILACEEDLTDNGLKDLVVICRTKEGNRTIVALDSGDSVNYSFTTPIPAPVENQKIQFKNLDKEGEIEFIITGEKKGAVGYAIYRIIDGEPADLFGEGMEDCC